MQETWMWKVKLEDGTTREGSAATLTKALRQIAALLVLDADGQRWVALSASRIAQVAP